MGAERIDQHVALALVGERIALDFHAAGQSLDTDGNRRGDVFLQALIHQIQSRADGHGGDSDANKKPHLLPERRCADEIAGFQILRGSAGDGGGDANHPANHERENGVVRRRPSGKEENRAGGHQSGDAHAADGIGRIAEQAADARRHGDKEKAEYGDEDAGKQILPPFRFRAFHGMKGEQYPEHSNDERGADDDPTHGDFAIDARAAIGLAGAFGASIF